MSHGWSCKSPSAGAGALPLAESSVKSESAMSGRPSEDKLEVPVPAAVVAEAEAVAEANDDPELGCGSGSRLATRVSHKL